MLNYEESKYDNPSFCVEAVIVVIILVSCGNGNRNCLFLKIAFWEMKEEAGWI